MNLAELKAISAYISSFAKLYHAKRVQDSVLKLECAQIQNNAHTRPKSTSKSTPISACPPHCQSYAQSHATKESIYMDLSRGDSSAYIAPAPIIAAKKYSAPFDIVLSRLNGADILGCEVLGGDRILRLHLGIRSAYKREEAYLQLEFCGKHTNAIILDSRFFVLEALRHISALKSTRPVKIHSPLPPMPSNPNASKNQKSNADLDGVSDFEMIKKMLISNYAKKSYKSIQSAKTALLSKLEKTKNSLESKLKNLQSADMLQKQAKELNAQASLALAHISKLKPYMQEVVLEEMDSNAVRKIFLPLAPTPQEAINQMFRESKKLAKRAKNIHLESTNLESKIDFIKKEIDFVQNSQNLDTLKILKPQKTKAKDSQIGLVFFIEGFKLSLGRNQAENKALLESARADDMWLHIREVPSSHLFIHCGKQAVSESVLQKASEILVGMSIKHSGDFFIDYTKRRFVKIIEGANVIYAKQKSIFVRK